jgi:hypothetical protein
LFKNGSHNIIVITYYEYGLLRLTIGLSTQPDPYRHPSKSCTRGLELVASWIRYDKDIYNLLWLVDIAKKNMLEFVIWLVDIPTKLTKVTNSILRWAMGKNAIPDQ